MGALKLNTLSVNYCFDETQSPEAIFARIQDFQKSNPSTEYIEINSPDSICPVCSLKTLNSTEDVYSCRTCTNSSNLYYYVGMCLKCAQIGRIHYRNLFCNTCTVEFKYSKCAKCKKLGYILSEEEHSTNKLCLKCLKYSYKSIYRQSVVALKEK